MATSNIQSLSSHLVTRTKTTASTSVPTGGVDFDILFSEFNSPGKPLSLASWSVNGHGVTNVSVYRAQLDFANNRVRISGKNTSANTLTLSATANVVFIE